MKAKYFIRKRGLLLIAALSVSALQGQWISNGPYGGLFRTLENHGGYLFAGADRGAFRSTDNGVSWSPAGTTFNGHQVYDFESSAAGLFAACDGLGLFFSGDNGNSWTARNNGLLTKSVFSVLKTDDGLYVGTSQGVHFSANNGLMWTPANSGIPGGQRVRSWAVMGDSVYAGTYGQGMYLSTNHGASWTKVAGNFPNTHATIFVYDIDVDGDEIMATTNFGIHRSTDRGQTWNAVNSPWPSGYHAFAIGENSGCLFAAVPNIGVFVSTDDGATWTLSNAGLMKWKLSSTLDAYDWFTDMIISGSKVVVASEQGLYRSSDNGSTWVHSDDGITAAMATGVCVNSNGVFAGTDGFGVYRTMNHGQSWLRTNTDLPNGNIQTMAANDACVFVSTSNYNLFRSTDNGQTWLPCSSGLPAPPFEMAANNQRVAVLTPASPSAPTKIFQSEDNGLTWKHLPIPESGLSAVDLYQHKIIIGTRNGILVVSENDGNSWMDKSNYLPDVEITTILTMDSIAYVGTAGLGIFRVNLNTQVAEAVSDGLGSLWINDLHYAHGLYFAATISGLYASADGDRWFDASGEIEERLITSLASDSAHVYVGTSSRVYQTGTDDEFFEMMMVLAGIPVKAKNSDAYFYPNPAAGKLYYSGPACEVSISDITGTLVKSSALQSGGSIDIRDCAPGLYFARSADGRIVQKVVVK